MVHSFLLIGQSNMGGRGFKEDVLPIQNKRLYVLRNGRWRAMYVPVNPDRVTSGINLSESFADRYANEKNVNVGLIPCADGGTCLDQWQVGSLLFDHTLYQAELAMRTSTIAGVLWHQGESDCSEERHLAYEEKLTVILDAFRDKLGLHDVPFLLGGLGDYLKDYTKSPRIGIYYPSINDALKRVAAKRERTAFVSAEGLGANPDNIHFSAKALREFGLRYYEEFLKLEDPKKIFQEKNTFDSGIQNELENL